jgi:hypothetical protein
MLSVADMAETHRDHPEVRIGRPGGDYVVIRVLGRMHPNAADYWDGNWLVTPLEIRAGGFRGDIAAALRADELERFARELDDLHESLSGEATLESMETWLTLHVNVAPSGQVTVAGTSTDQPGMGNRLTFEVNDLDQADLPGIIQALSGIGEAFPVLGSPPDAPETLPAQQ